MRRRQRVRTANGQAWVFLENEAGRATSDGSVDLSGGQRIAASRRSSAVQCTRPQTSAASVLLSESRRGLVFATAPPPSTAGCEHPQWSPGSPVWLTGDRGLCCARSSQGPDQCLPLTTPPVRPQVARGLGVLVLRVGEALVFAATSRSTPPTRAAMTRLADPGCLPT